MRDVIVSSRFKKDYVLMQKRGLKMSKLVTVLKQLETGQNLDERYRVHTLKGQYEGLFECHI